MFDYIKIFASKTVDDSKPYKVKVFRRGYFRYTFDTVNHKEQ